MLPSPAKRAWTLNPRRECLTGMGNPPASIRASTKPTRPLVTSSKASEVRCGAGPLTQCATLALTADVRRNRDLDAGTRHRCNNGGIQCRGRRLAPTVAVSERRPSDHPADRTKGKTGLTTPEREELARLRKENRILLGDMPTIVLSRNLNAFASSRPHTPRSRESRATHDISSSSTPANITCSPRIASSRSTCLPPSDIHS
jgi:hypothetical protein